MAGVADYGADHHAARAGIDAGTDCGDLAVEHAAGKRSKRDAHLLADAKRRTVRLGDLGQHPHAVDIGDGEWRGRVARLHEQAGGRVARRDAAINRARHDQGRIGAALSDDAVDIGVGLAEEAHRITRRPQIAFGGLLIGCRLVEIALRYCQRPVQLAKPRQVAGGKFQHAGCGNQGGLGLQQVRAVDGEQGLAFFDVVPDRGVEGDDATLIGGEHLHRHVLVEVDTADRLLLDWKLPLRDRFDLDVGQLGIRQVDAVALACGNAGRVARRGIGACRRLELGSGRTAPMPSPVGE